jgi:OmpA-OmpF porin, OOP family
MKKQLTIALGILFFSMLQAQEKQQYLHITAGGGLHNLSYELQNGTQSGRFGNTINAGYSYFFTQHWGIQSGLGLQWFNARSTVNFLSAIPQVDIDGESFEFRANYNNWQEKQHALFLDIPLTIQYRQALSNKISLQGSAGGKISIPIRSSYETTGGSITTTGYYSRLNAELSDFPEFGFTTITNSYSGKLSLRPSYMAIADFGGLYALSPKIDLYMGAYFNYGLNNALKANSQEIYQFDGVYNGVLASNQTTKVNLVSVGVKVGIYFRINKTKEVRIADELSVITQPSEIIQQKDTVIAPQTEELSMITQPSEIIQQKDTVIAPQKVETVAVVAIEQSVNKPSIPVEKEKIAEPQPDKRSIITLYFAKNSDKKIQEESEKIKELSDMLKTNPNLCLRITGHTCNWGTHRNNLRVGLRRANSVRAKLIVQGASSNQLTTESKGDNEPLVPNTSEANRKKNRRVEIKVVNCNS